MLCAAATAMFSSGMAALGKLFEEGDCVYGGCDWLVVLMRRGKREEGTGKTNTL